MDKYYGTIERTQTWNFVVEADSLEEAEEKCVEFELIEPPDYTSEEVTLVEKVEKYVD